MKSRLAYFDSFAGLVPCKVVAILRDAYRGTNLEGQTCACDLKVKLTATRGTYKRGELIFASALHIVPRSHVRGNRILGGYKWQEVA